MAKNGFEPGSFGCHEALHTAMICAEMVDDRLCRHASIVQNKEWYRMATEACGILNELYQKIGAAHNV